jgi:hypothetical protein
LPFLTGSKKPPLEREMPRLPGISIPFSRTNKEFSVHTLVRPPMKVGVCFKLKDKNKDGQWSKKAKEMLRYKIEVPWQAFMVRMNRVGAITDTFMWFMKGKPVDEDAEVFMPPLPNIYPSGHICNGTIKVNFEDPPHEKIHKAFEAFWTTPFTEETYPENDELIPRCWSSGEHKFHIEYGYLRYVFDYWQEHDEQHETRKWIERNGPCAGFPWSFFKILNGKHKMAGQYVHTLGAAMDYALSFIPMKRSE